MAGTYEQKDLTGSLFKNSDKKSDNHPDYNGSVLVGGQAYWLNAWLKTAKNGTKYMSLSLKIKEERGASQGGGGGGGRQQQAPARSQQSYDEQRGGGRHGGGDARHSRDYDREGGGPIDDIPFAPDRH